MEQSYQTREIYLAAWQRSLLEKESALKNKEFELKSFEQNLDEVIKKESEILASEKHCSCCKLNLTLQPDTVYLEWGYFKGIPGSETRVGTTFVGEVYMSDTFYNIYSNWKNTDIGKIYQESNLKSIFVTKLDLSWTANDWRMVGNFNSKIIICEISKRYKVKFIIE
jgi:hypothetical protein